MHLEYCPYGDISRLQDTHSEEVRWIPEPAIWYILECLANAGLIFHQGDIDRPRNHWTEEIVHRDLKPENVFMGEFPEPVPTGDNWVCYPTVKVGDYVSLQTPPSVTLRESEELVLTTLTHRVWQSKPPTKISNAIPTNTAA